MCAQGAPNPACLCHFWLELLVKGVISVPWQGLGYI